jgi:hypothetical protein
MDIYLISYTFYLIFYSVTYVQKRTSKQRAGRRRNHCAAQAIIFRLCTASSKISEKTHQAVQEDKSACSLNVHQVVSIT